MLPQGVKASSRQKRLVAAVREREALYRRGVVRYGEAHGENKDMILVRGSGEGPAHLTDAE